MNITVNLDIGGKSYAVEADVSPFNVASALVEAFDDEQAQVFSSFHRQLIQRCKQAGSMHLTQLDWIAAKMEPEARETYGWIASYVGESL